MSYQWDVLSALRKAAASIRESSEALKTSIDNQTRTYLEFHQQDRVITVKADEWQEKKRSADHDKDQALQKRGLWIQGFLCLFTALAFGAAAYYASVANQQRITMDRTFALSARATWLDQRPWVAVSDQTAPLAQPNGPIGITIEIANTGKTPAQKFKGRFVFGVFDASAMPDFHDETKYASTYLEGGGGALIPGFKKKTLINAAGGTKEKPEKVLYTPTFAKQLERSSDHLLILYGKLDYEDVLGVTHWIEICEPFMLGRAPHSQSRACAEYNKTDNNEPANTK